MYRVNFFVLLFCFGMLFSCTSDTQEGDIITNEIFQELDENSTGLKFSNDLSPDSTLNILEYLYYYNGGGVAIGDINNDGLEDVLLTANQKPDQLFLNEGGLKFKNISKESNIILDNSWSTGAAMDDVNGDGLLDIYICKSSPISKVETHNQLYINNGDLTFTESAKQYGLDFTGYGTHASFFDYDKDGDLDVYLLNHSVHSVSSFGSVERRKEKSVLSGDRLFKNQGNTFIDVTESAGIYSSALGYGLALSTADINNDGWPDIYVGNDFHENDYIYINNKDGSFTEQVSELLNHSSKFSMGVDVADMNRDGLVDIFTTDMLPFDHEVVLQSGGEDTDQVFEVRNDFGYEDQYARNHFQLQKTTGQFVDIALSSNTYATDWSWSVLLQDFDNNGLEDIFISNGIKKRPNNLDYINFLNQQGIASNEQLTTAQMNRYLEYMPEEPMQNIMFLQDTLLNFSPVEQSNFGSPGFSNGAAYADFDNDGDLDLLVNNIDAPVSLYENSANKNSNYVTVALKDPGGLSVKGSKLRLFVGATILEKALVTTRGYQSSVTHRIHFGLGDIDAIDSMVVIWPDFSKQKLKDIKLNRLFTIEKETTLTKTFDQVDREVKKATILPFSFQHRENEFSDYNYDKLIPELLSKEGPTAAYADFNGDGLQDLYIGGARFQEAALFHGKADGTYRKIDNADFARDAKYEDVDTEVFDFNNDGYLDLYVLSGGNDADELDKLLEDRLYLNDRKGVLRRLPLSLPHTNGGSVSSGDFDGDGFTDLFIGGRSMPRGYYGLSPFSFVLKNVEGQVVEILHKERYGMITDSQSGDVDQDGDIDIVICGDWMNIVVLENQGDGSLLYKTSEIGLDNTGGLWNSISLHDWNGDGTLDILAGNAGLNFKWKASEDKPVKLFVTDLDQGGRPEALIFHDYFGTYKPFSSLSQLQSELPGLKKQFVQFKDFASVQEIQDFELFSADKLIEEKYIHELRSMLYLSEDGKYKAVPLPLIAQQSSIEDILTRSNGEVLLVGNNSNLLTELGENSGSSGVALSDFNMEKAQFNQANSLHLPLGLNAKQIIKLKNSQYLILINNETHMLLQR